MAGKSDLRETVVKRVNKDFVGLMLVGKVSVGKINNDDSEFVEDHSKVRVVSSLENHHSRHARGYSEGLAVQIQVTT